MTEYAELISKAIQEMEASKERTSCIALTGETWKGIPCCKAIYRDGTYKLQKINWRGKLVCVKKRTEQPVDKTRN